jgi:hypothetical protein
MEPVKSLKTLGMIALGIGLASCTGKVVGKTGTGSTGSGTGVSGPVSSGSGTGTASTGSSGSPSGSGSGTTATGTTGAGTTGAAPAGGAPTSGVGNATAPATAPTNPGVVVLRRLNAAEYNATVHDLLGTTLTPANGFPADDLGGEFTTVGSSLSLSPNYVREYENAAFALMDDLFAAPQRLASIVTCSVDTGGDACARTIVTALARRAFRRVPTTAQIDTLMTPVASAKTLGLTATDGLKAALSAVLMSPYFIFKVETDPAGTTGMHRLNAYELATRLSYAIWGSMPDATLSAAADANQVTTDAQLGVQIDRMMADPRASSLLDQFAGAWLDFNSIVGHEVDTTVFPAFTDATAASMRLEARNFIQDFLSSTQPASSMLTANFTYVDAGLAKAYGLSATGAKPGADGTWRADTSATQRSGLLTLGSILTTTSLPTRTSPVRRGDFIFSRLLCGTIPPPPDNVSTLPLDTSLSLRASLEAHRSSPACSGCHSIMDPLGFGLENFDGVGNYRTLDGTTPIDATGTLTDGTPFNGAKEMGAALSKDPRFAPCITQKFMTYSIGRLMNQPDDANWANFLAQQAQLTNNGSLGSVIRTVLLSEAFRSRSPQ